MHKQSLHTIDSVEVPVIVLNAVENAILRYGNANKGFIDNPYQWFGKKLGYKTRNYLYRVFENRIDAKLGYRDIREILKITQDTCLFQAVEEDLKNMINQNAVSPNQLTLIK